MNKGTKVIPREARKVTYSTEIRNLKTISLSNHQRDIVIGSILGDGYLVPNWSKTNYALRVTRSGKQKEYTDWQYANLKPFVLTEPRWYERTQSYTIGTISHSEITKLYSVFYPKGKKIVPETIGDYIKSPLVLAVWFMDDGNLASSYGIIRGYHLNTQSFSFKENERLSVMLKTNFGIDCTIQKNHDYFRLFIRAGSRERFKNLIKNQLIESMRYKLG